MPQTTVTRSAACGRLFLLRICYCSAQQRINTVLRAFSTQHRKTLFVVHLRVFLLCKSCFNVKSVSRIVISPIGLFSWAIDYGWCGHLVSPVRNQMESQACWTFCGTAAAPSGVFMVFLYVIIIHEWKTLKLACFCCELGTLLGRFWR